MGDPARASPSIRPGLSGGSNRSRLLAPGVGLLAIFISSPTLLTIWLSFQNWSSQTGFETARSSELQNFCDIFGDSSVGRDFRRALGNTAIYSVLSIAIILPLVRRPRACSYPPVPGAAKCIPATVLFSTYMVPMIAVALVWSKLYSPTEGPLNQMLGWIGMPRSPGFRRRNRPVLARLFSTSGSRWATSPCSWSPG